MKNFFKIKDKLERTYYQLSCDRKRESRVRKIDAYSGEIEEGDACYGWEAYRIRSTRRESFNHCREASK